MNKPVDNCACGNCIKSRYTFNGGHYIYEYIHELNTKLNQLDEQMMLDIKEIETAKEKDRHKGKFARQYNLEIELLQDNYKELKNALCIGYFIETPQSQTQTPPPLPPPNPKKKEKQMEKPLDV